MENMDDIVVIEDKLTELPKNDNCDVKIFMDQINCETTVEALVSDDIDMGEITGSETEQGDSVESIMSSADFESTESETNEIDSAMLIRQVLDQNVSEQKLPSDGRADWAEFDDRGNCNCELKNDAELKVIYKSNGEIVTYTGEEFKEHMREKYGLDHVEYLCKEPDFAPFEKLISKEEMEDFLYHKYGEKREIISDVEGHVFVDQMKTERRGNQGTYSDAENEIACKLGIDISDIRDFMRANDLTWHECGDRHTIRMIPSEINQVFRHTGGIGIQKDFKAFVEGIENRVGVPIQKLALHKENHGG